MATLTTTKILSDVAYKLAVRAPLLTRVSSEFTSEPLKLGQTAIAHIIGRPTVQAYDETAGYGANSTSTKDLVQDVSIVIDQHKHVALDVTYLQAQQDQKQVYEEAINQATSELAKSIVDDGLAKILAANFTENTSEVLGDVDRDTLGAVRKAMNKRGVQNTGRTAIVNSDVFEQLDADPRINSKDYHGQQTEGEGLGVLKNVAGFSEVFEYPDMPDNGESLGGFAMGKNALCIKTGIPADIEKIRNSVGAPATAKFETITDPDSGITLLGIFWSQPGTFKVMMNVTLLWGWSVGTGGGAAGDLHDFEGHRLVTT